MLTILPDLWLRMTGKTSCVRRKTPKKFVSKSCLASSMLVSSAEPKSAIPALFTSTSIQPARSTTYLTAELVEFSSRTSIGINLTVPRSWPSLAGSRMVPNTRYPTFTSAVAVARPIPDETPVINATFCLSISVLPNFRTPVSSFLVTMESSDQKQASKTLRCRRIASEGSNGPGLRTQQQIENDSVRDQQ